MEITILIDYALIINSISKNSILLINVILMLSLIDYENGRECFNQIIVSFARFTIGALDDCTLYRIVHFKVVAIVDKMY